ncbi:unnamed protein product [Sphagnum jensenii]|uniref:Uncharacterized protein n=1 Tax=Sphagnum jensenii TaxID=128206 RepID=A0ABP0WLT6_9BRYO
MGASRISSSSDDGEDEGHASRLASVAIDSAAVVLNASSSAPSLRNGRGKLSSDQLVEAENQSKGTSSGLKLYQIRLQDLLYKHLDKTVGETFAAQPLLATEQTIECHENGLDEVEKDVDIRLFSRAPPGIVIKKPGTISASLVKPNLKRGYSIDDEDSDEHLVRLQAAAIDGETIRAEAKHAMAKALATSQVSAEVAEKAAKREEERVAALKRERGEEWLPAIAAQLGLPLKSTKIRQDPQQLELLKQNNTQTT